MTSDFMRMSFDIQFLPSHSLPTQPDRFVLLACKSDWLDQLVDFETNTEKSGRRASIFISTSPWSLCFQFILFGWHLDHKTIGILWESKNRSGGFNQPRFVNLAQLDNCFSSMIIKARKAFFLVFEILWELFARLSSFICSQHNVWFRANCTALPNI